MFGSQYLLHVNAVFKSPAAVGDKFVIPLIEDITTLAESNPNRTISYKNYSVSMDFNGNPIELQSGALFTFEESGSYKLTYSGVIQNVYTIGGGGAIEENFSFSYTFQVVENTLPLKKWTITDVINRLLDLAEPIRKGEKPRFLFNGMRFKTDENGKIVKDENGNTVQEIITWENMDVAKDELPGQALLFDKILCPQLSFTKEHLRECLQEVGKVIHGEPRLIPKKFGNEWVFWVGFDMYGGAGDHWDDPKCRQQLLFSCMPNDLTVPQNLQFDQEQEPKHVEPLEPEET